MQDARFKVLTLLEIREKATARELAELVGARREAVGMLLVPLDRSSFLAGFGQNGGKVDVTI
jgi:hypothetical protein